MAEQFIDVNSDLGERYGAFSIGADTELFPIISSANVACGFHGGDPKTIDRTLKAATANGVRVGAHPSYPDLVGFGRRNIAASPEDVYTDVLYQIGALDAFCRAQGITMQHVKAHGALSNVAAKERATADAIMAAVAAFDRTLKVMALPQSQLQFAAEAAGLPVILEAFADRAYNQDYTLVSRAIPGAMITDPELAAERMTRLVFEGVIETIDGIDIPLPAESICIHSDTSTAVAIATALKRRFDAEGIVIRAPGTV